VILQWGFDRTGVLSPMLVATNAILGGFLLLAAGVYQLTPIKHACLRHCRSPLAFLGTHWLRGARGALRMGLLHGAFCVGCCWFLMELMFFGGVMNLYWIAGLALFVLFEKTVPTGHWLGYATGVALLAWGAGMLALAF
jgi:predicted metal-binding membrane protein